MHAGNGDKHQSMASPLIMLQPAADLCLRDGDGTERDFHLVLFYDRTTPLNVTKSCIENIRLASVTNRGRSWSLVHHRRWIIAMNPDTTFPIVRRPNREPGAVVP